MRLSAEMLKLLLDEHISGHVAKGLRRIDRKILIKSLVEWEDGSFLGRDDEACLREAARQMLTIVTYDLRTIPPLLKVWAETGQNHGGIIFVDAKTIAPSDIGALVRALAAVAKASREWDWTDRVLFLAR
jgi:hypothetical protein